MQLSVPDMSCGHCRAAVTQALTALDPSAQVRVDLTTRKVDLTTSAPVAAVVAALDAAGYAAAPI